MRPTRYSGKNGFNETIELSFAPDPGNKIHISNDQKGYVVVIAAAWSFRLSPNKAVDTHRR